MTPTVWDLVDGFCTWGAARAVLDVGAPHGDPARMEPLLALLASNGLASRVDGEWSVDEDALRLLVNAPGPGEAWLALPATLRAGAPAVAVDDDPAAFYGPLVAATGPVQRPVADAVVPGLGLPAAASVLDLGCGAAPWARSVLAADATATAVCVDLPGVVEQAAGERVTCVAGDYLAAPVDGPFDLVVLGHVLRAEDDVRAAALVARAASLVRAGGVVVVTEYALDDDRLGPPAAVRMAAIVAATLRRGRVRTRSELLAVVADAGLVDASFASHPPTDVLVARRPPEAT